MPYGPLLPQRTTGAGFDRPATNQDLLRFKQPQQRTIPQGKQAEAVRYIDNAVELKRITEETANQMKVKYGLPAKITTYKSKKDVAGIEKYTEGPDIRKRVFPGAKKPPTGGWTEKEATKRFHVIHQGMKKPIPFGGMDKEAVMEEMKTLRPHLPKRLQGMVDSITGKKVTLSEQTIPPEWKTVGKTPEGLDIYEDEQGNRWLD